VSRKLKACAPFATVDLRLSLAGLNKHDDVSRRELARVRRQAVRTVTGVTPGPLVCCAPSIGLPLVLCEVP